MIVIEKSFVESDLSPHLASVYSFGEVLNVAKQKVISAANDDLPSPRELYLRSLDRLQRSLPCRGKSDPSLLGVMFPDLAPAPQLPESELRVIAWKANLANDLQAQAQRISSIYLSELESIVRELIVFSVPPTFPSLSPIQLLISSKEILRILKSSGRSLVYGSGGIRGINFVWMKNIQAAWSSDLLLSSHCLQMTHDMIADIFDSLLSMARNHQSEGSGSTLDFDENHKQVVTFSFQTLELQIALPWQSEERRDSLLTDRSIITLQELRRVLPMVIKGKEIQERIQSFAEVMITSFNRSLALGDIGTLLKELEQGEDLQFEVATTYFLAQQNYGLILTTPCALYLTAICQSLSLYILSKGQEVVSKESEGFLLSSHLFSAIQSCEDLKATFRGILPSQNEVNVANGPPLRRQENNTALRRPNRSSSDSSSDSDSDSDSEDDDDDNCQKRYNALIKSLLRSSPNGVIIDPITGFHISKENIRCHDYDAACALPASERAKAAYRLCTDEEQIVVDQYLNRQNSSAKIRQKHQEASRIYASTPAISRDIFQYHLRLLTESCLQDHLETMGHHQPTRCQFYFTTEATTILHLSVEQECVRKVRDVML
jgi:hypothetical protein